MTRLICMTESRKPTVIDEIAESYVDGVAKLAPELNIWLGREEHTGRFANYSPEGNAEFNEFNKQIRAKLESATPIDSIDEVTKADLGAVVQLDIEKFDAGLFKSDLNVISTQPQAIREIFDLMPTASEQDWSDIRNRLNHVAKGLSDYAESLKAGIAEGSTPAKRQIVEVSKQINGVTAENGTFRELVASATDIPENLAKELVEAANAATEGYAQFQKFLDNELLQHGKEVDGVGRDRYALESRYFLGAVIDLDETYEWGKEELARMVSEQESIAREILPNASNVKEVVEYLDNDPSRKLHGTDELKKWMQKVSDAAIADLSDKYFEIAEPIKELECMIAPSNSGIIYYTGPSDDFTRPGRMWWSVPEGVTEFNTWRELTTVYHEGVPGHHLQIAQATYNRAQLNTWRRIFAGTSGHAEGWALYAERLMEELGYLDDPANRLGMLDGQRMRAARVVLDIGVHLGKPRLDGKGTWDADYALDFFRQHVNMNDEFIKFEVNRYLGWPGQAPSYKVGQRIWENIRRDAESKQGAAFNLKQFHKDALDIGGVGLDTLQKVMLG